MKGYSKILVTGGAGFIGSHVVDRLMSEDREVFVLDDFTAGRMSNISHHKDKEKFHLIRGDIRDFKLVEKTIPEIDAVFHLAALTGVAPSIENPRLFNEVNVCGTLNLLKACLNSDVKRFIFSSSAAVYGNSRSRRKTEDMAPEPLSPYAVSKLAAEQYVQIFNKLYSLQTVSLRYFNVYGPRQNSGSSYTGVVTTFIDRLLNDRPPIIHGDGNQTRDFIYVKDVVSANMLALHNNSVVGEVLNISSGKETSIRELAKMLKNLTAKEHIEPIFAEERTGDIKHCFGEISRAKKHLGFQPETELEPGLSKLVKWHLNTIRDCE